MVTFGEAPLDRLLRGLSCSRYGSVGRAGRAVGGVCPLRLGEPLCLLDRGVFLCHIDYMTHTLTGVAMPENLEFTKRLGAARAIDYFKGARCKGVPVEKFFPEKRVREGSYMRFCEKCPIQDFCLQFAVCFDSYGVWGGLTRKQRKTLPKAFIEDAIETGKEEGWYWILEDVEDAVDAIVDAVIAERESNTSLGSFTDRCTALGLPAI